MTAAILYLCCRALQTFHIFGKFKLIAKYSGKYSKNSTCQVNFSVRELEFAGVSAYVECYHDAGIYLDGVYTGFAEHNKRWVHIIPQTTRLVGIAAYAEIDVGTGYIAASFSNGFKTSSMWRCSTHPTHGWYKLDFDDSGSGWSSAHENGQFGNLTGAPKIWEKTAGDGYIFCRGLIGMTMREKTD